MPSIKAGNFGCFFIEDGYSCAEKVLMMMMLTKKAARLAKLKQWKIVDHHRCRWHYRWLWGPCNILSSLPNFLFLPVLFMASQTFPASWYQMAVIACHNCIDWTASYPQSLFLLASSQAFPMFPTVLWGPPAPPPSSLKGLDGCKYGCMDDYTNIRPCFKRLTI